MNDLSVISRKSNMEECFTFDPRNAWQSRTLTSLEANCGDSGSPQPKSLYFSSLFEAVKWTKPAEGNDHRLPKDEKGIPMVITHQVHCWKDIKTEDYFIKAGRADDRGRQLYKKVNVIDMI